MRIVLRYTRLPKPRGRWNFPLRVVFKVEYSASEMASLSPDWETSRCSWPSIGLVDPEAGSFYRSMPDRKFGPLHPVVDTVFYLQCSEIRETLITWLLARRDECVGASQKFWDDNPPVPGEPEAIMDVDVCDGVVGTPASEEPTVRRKVRVMTHVGEALAGVGA